MWQLSRCMSHRVPFVLKESKEKPTLWRNWNLSLILRCQLSSLKECNLNLFFFSLCVIGMGVPSASRTVYELICIF